MITELTPFNNIELITKCGDIDVYKMKNPEAYDDTYKELFFITPDKEILIKWKHIIQSNENILIHMLEQLDSHGLIILE